MTEKDYSLQPIEFDPFAGPEIEKVVPAIEPQTEIWASYQLGGEDANCSYNESVSLELRGTLNLSALKQALASVIQRHEALRSGFSADGTQLCIFKNIPLPFQYQDISSLSTEPQKNTIADFLVKDASTSFNIQTGPLFRIHLFKQAETIHHLTLSAHHIICDGWSIGIVMQDIAKIYSSVIQDEIPASDPAPSFAEYATQQKLFHRTKEYQAIEEYWLDQYKHDIPILDLPTDKIRPEIRTYKSHRDDYTLEPGLVSAVKKLGADAGCSFVTTMIVAFEVFLHKVSGQEDIVLGIPSAGQAAEDNSGLVGHCVNMLPVRSRHTGNSSFHDVLKHRRTAIFDAYENQQITFGSLLKKMNIPRDTSRIPLIPIVFNIDIGLDEGVKFKGLEHTLNINKREYENFEIFLNASGSGNTLTLEWSYNTHLFEAGTISRMMKDFESLLYAVTENPEILVGDIAVHAPVRLNESDKQIKIQGHLVDLAAIEHWLNIQDGIKESIVIPREDYPGDERLIAYITSEDVSETNSSPSWQERWEDLYKRGAQAESNLEISEQKLDTAVAQQLSGREDIGGEVDEWLEQSASRIRKLCTKNVMELGCGAGQLVFKIAPLAEHFVATDYSSTAIEKLNEKITAEPERFKNVKTVIAPADDLSSVTPNSLDLVIINGVVQYFPDAEYLIKVIGESAKAIKPGGCIYIGDMQGKSTLPMYHASDQIARTDGHQQISDFKKIVERRIRVEDELLADPNFFYLIPQVLPAITGVNIQLREGRHLNETTKYHYDIWLYVNAEPKTVESEIIIPWQPGFNLDAISNYITNNSSSVICIQEIYNSRTAADHLLQEILKTAGDQTPVKDIRDSLLDIKPGLNPHSLWELGQAKGFDTHVRWTSDGSDGLFDVIFIPQHLENKIPGPPPEADATKNIYDYSRNALSENLSLTSEQSRAWKQSLSEELPYYMIPSEFVILKKLPLLPNGKIDKNALPKPEERLDEPEINRAPQTETEKLVAKVWAEVLRVEALSLNDDFFELGGHSLLAVQVMIRLEKETGIRLPLTTLFKFSTLEQFAHLFSKS